jgi:hypothetical protein
LKKQVNDILEKNNKRLEIINQPYDPIMGIGSPIERFPFFFTKNQKSAAMLPLRMMNNNIIQEVVKTKKSLEEYCDSNGMNYNDIQQKIIELRFDEDFEFWCAVTVKIKPKDGGNHIPFILNQAQRKIIYNMEIDRIENKPIRIILLKARQLGGSTVIQIYMSWIQLRLKTNWNSLIAAHINQAATNIRSMYNNLVKTYPLASYKLSPFEGTKNIKIIHERSNKITVGSMETPDSIRSDDIAMCHLSEVGLWKKTEGKEPEDLVQSILGTIPMKALSLVALESTAKGVASK